jgi:hypothetical protein
MLLMHERKKNVSSASVIWYTVLFRQNRTYRPIGVFEQRKKAFLRRKNK